MLPNSFYSSSELGLLFPPFEVQNPNLYVIATFLQTPAFSVLGLNFCFILIIFASSVGEKKNSEVWVVFFIYISEGCFFFYFFFYFVFNWGITSEGLYFIIGFYEVFKKKSFKQRLCLACNTLCALCLLSEKKVYTSVHLTWSHSNICRIHQETRLPMLRKTLSLSFFKLM